VRPTDENQPGSRRPNLMSSSRRATSEINILAMLDGQAPGRRLRALPAVVWYGVAGVLACSLLVVIAWLVRGATPARDNTSVDVPGTRATLTAESPLSMAAPKTYATPAAAVPARGAVIIDLPQPAAIAASDVARHAAAGTTAHPPSATSRHPVTRPATPAVPYARPQPESRTTASRALAHADPAPPRQKRPAGASRTAPSTAGVDTDVALISAILQHTGTRNEAADGAGTAACTDKPCGPRMPPRQ